MESQISKWCDVHGPCSSSGSGTQPSAKAVMLCIQGTIVMLTLFWDEKRWHLEALHIARDHYIISASYSDLLKCHRWSAIKSKRLGLLSAGVLLQHDNARPQSSRATVATITDLKFECLLHPPCSPDFSSSEFHMLESLKKALGGKNFRSDEVRHVVHEWLYTLLKKLFSAGIRALCKRWQTCIECGGY